jgi:hypothetical protein
MHFLAPLKMPNGLGFGNGNDFRKSLKLVRLSRLQAQAGRHPQQLGAYSRQRSRFALKLDFAETAFQKQVWEAWLNIPFGQSCFYDEIAKQIGRPKAVRAIGANGTLTGFASGLSIKAQLLAPEKSAIQELRRKRLAAICGLHILNEDHASCCLAAATTCATSKPKCASATLPGADMPKLRIAIMVPRRPT